MPEHILEKKHVEAPVVKYARDRGIIVLKLNVMGQRGWPDRAFFAPKRRFKLIEFKRPGEVPTPLQRKKHDDLRALGFDVDVVDDPNKGKALIDSMLR